MPTVALLDLKASSALGVGLHAQRALFVSTVGLRRDPEVMEREFFAIRALVRHSDRMHLVRV